MFEGRVRRQGGDEGDVARFREIGGGFGRSRRLRSNGWTPEEVERRIWDEDVEWAYVFDRWGGRCCENGVRRMGCTLASMRCHCSRTRCSSTIIRLSGSIRAGTHGTRGVILERDLDLVLTYDIAEMRVVTPGWRYVLVRPVGGWVPDADSAATAYGEELTRLRASDVVAVGRGLMTWENAQATLTHRVMQQLAVWGQVPYRREEW